MKLKNYNCHHICVRKYINRKLDMNKLNKIIKSSFLNLLLFFLIGTTFASAEKLINKDFSNFKVELIEDNNSTKLKITSNDKIEIKDLFDLENPNRIVVDINNLKLKSNKNLNTKNSKELKQIRLGKHSNKVRFVLDLKGNAIPKFNWSAENEKTISLVINNNTTLALPQKPIITKKTTDIVVNKKSGVTNIPKAEQLVKDKLVDQNIIQNDNIAKSNLRIANNKENAKNPKKLNPIKEKRKNENSDAEQGLENIKFYFKKEKKTPLVRFIMVKKPAYTLKKKDSKKYILTIDDANIRWPHLELPQFPPRDFRGFTMIMPERKNGRLEISIGVERDSKVSSFTKDNEVWLKIDGY